MTVYDLSRKGSFIIGNSQNESWNLDDYVKGFGITEESIFADSLLQDDAKNYQIFREETLQEISLERICMKDNVEFPDISDIQIYDENTELVKIYGCGSSCPTRIGLENLTIEFSLLIDEKKYRIAFQIPDRNDNLKFYNGIDLIPAVFLDYQDDYDKILEIFGMLLMQEKWQKFIEHLEDIAYAEATIIREKLIKEEKNNV